MRRRRKKQDYVLKRTHIHVGGGDGLGVETHTVMEVVRITGRTGQSGGKANGNKGNNYITWREPESTVLW